jgi:hypothetical protein
MTGLSQLMGAVLGGRQGTLQATSSSAQTISELLQKTAQMYEHGDRKGAATLRAAGEVLENSQSAGAAGSSGAPAGAAGASGAGGGADLMGQLVGHVGQQVGSQFE